MNKSPEPSLLKLWQCQPVEGIKMSADEIRKRSIKFERKIFWRNIREYVASGIATALFVWFFLGSHDTLFRAACALCIAGLAYMTYQLHRRASARAMPMNLGAANSLVFHRTELERQRDFIGNIWRWYLGPLVPGLAMFSLQSILAAHNHAMRAALVNSIFVLSLALVWKLNAYEARCLQGRIDELKSAEQG